MIIEKGCVRLRAIEEKDFDLLFYMMNTPGYDLQTGSIKPPISEKEQREWIKNYHNTADQFRLMIETVEGNTVGMIGIHDTNWINRVTNIFYKVTFETEKRMKGDLHDAIQGVLEYAFMHMGMNCVQGTFLVSNVFSRKAARKAGLKEEGIVRQRVYFDGKFHDQLYMSILRDEYLEMVESKK